ncbi:MAG: VTT domain-containing protein [Bacteroidota bacterium]
MLLPLTLSAFGFQYIKQLLLWIEQAPHWGLLVFSLLSVLTMAFALSPTTFVALLAGFLFPGEYFFSLLITYPIAALLGRFLGLHWFRFFQAELMGSNQTYQDFLVQLAERPFWVLVLARLSPVLPFAMTNLLLGQVVMPWSTYLSATMIGMLPRTLLSFWVGTQVKDIVLYLESPQTLSLERWIVLALLLLSSLGLLLIIGRIFRRLGFGK